MKNRIFINLCLLLGIAALLLYLNKPAVETVVKPPISSVKAKAITSISIYRQHSETILLEKDELGWKIIQPIKAKANDVRVNLLLDLLSTVSQSHFKPSKDTDLRQFGLAPARVSLRLNEEEFQFGDIESLSKLRYIGHNEVIHLIKDTLVPLLNASVASFIDNRLLPSQAKINRIELPLLSANANQVSEDRLQMTLSEGHWTSNISNLSTDALVAIVSAWQQAYAMQVLLLDEQNMQTLNGHRVTINYTNREPSEFILQLSDSNISLINLATKLKFQFPASMKRTLFAHAESD